MGTLRETIRKSPWIGWTLFILTVVIVFLVGLLTSNIMERRTEALYVNQQKIQVNPYDPRSEVWGVNYPKTYASWKATADTSFRSKHNGSGMIDMLERYPNLVILWAGYGFAKDYNQARGHYYAVEDVYNSLRTGAPMGPDDGPMPATCWTCKSPDVPRLMSEIGAKDFYTGKWARHGGEVVNSIGCADCHNEKTMDLRITRPALIEAFQSMGKDVNQASHQEMRSLVCAQCHVEYYFNKKTPYEGVPYLTFPWKNGLTVEDMEKYYDDIQFSDWKHGLSKAPMIKAQHPGYELFQQGIHAKRGVSCADCHMPYKTEGGVKFTDHHIRSPLNNISNSCQVCHRESEEQLTQNVNDNLDKVIEARGTLEDLLAELHLEAKFLWDLGATDAQMKDILADIRAAQWRWDYAAASHGGGFHAPVEALRIVSDGINRSQEGRLKAARLAMKLGHEGEIPIPDISTKAKAQTVAGLDMQKLNADKANFLQTVLPQWLDKAKQRESQWPQYETEQAATIKSSM